MPGELGDLTVGRDAAARDLADHRVHRAEQLLQVLGVGRRDHARLVLRMRDRPTVCQPAAPVAHLHPRGRSRVRPQEIIRRGRRHHPYPICRRPDEPTCVPVIAAPIASDALRVAAASSPNYRARVAGMERIMGTGATRPVAAATVDGAPERGHADRGYPGDRPHPDAPRGAKTSIAASA